MWSTPSSTARRSTAIVASRSRGRAEDAGSGELHRAEADAGDRPVRELDGGGSDHVADGIRSKRNGRSDYTEGTGMPLPLI